MMRRGSWGASQILYCCFICSAPLRFFLVTLYGDLTVSVFFCVVLLYPPCSTKLTNYEYHTHYHGYDRTELYCTACGHCTVQCTVQYSLTVQICCLYGLYSTLARDSLCHRTVSYSAVTAISFSALVRSYFWYPTLRAHERIPGPFVRVTVPDQRSIAAA